MTTTIVYVLTHMLQQLHMQGADRVEIENSTFDYIHQQASDLKVCDAYWLYDQDKFVIEFKTIDCDQLYVVCHIFEYLSGQKTKADTFDAYDRAMKGV